jgi:hypothetical protein
MAISARLSSKTGGTDGEGDGRLVEIAEILATGLSRLVARKSSRMSAEFGETSLHARPER